MTTTPRERLAVTIHTAAKTVAWHPTLERQIAARLEQLPVNCEAAIQLRGLFAEMTHWKNQ